MNKMPVKRGQAWTYKDHSVCFVLYKNPIRNTLYDSFGPSWRVRWDDGSLGRAHLMSGEYELLPIKE